jgi:N-acetylglucosaminyl-diphospho-decaprenol L-rhamnosyltransferase
MTGPDVSVIVVGWNVRDLTVRCIDTLLRRSEGVSLQVILVDNASSDGTAAAVRSRFPEVEVLEPGENLGFPRANNLALDRVRGRYILYLNPDTEVGEGTVAATVAALDAEPGLGAVGCRLLYPDGTVQREGARNAYRLRDLAYELLYLHMLFPRSRVFGHHLMGDWDHGSDRDVEAICGAFILTRADLAREIGGLPDDVFMYFEDLAFCLRVRQRGYRIRYLARVHTIHYTNQSSLQRRDARWDLLEPEYKVRLIRERSGPVAGVAARALFAIRSLIRIGLTAASYLLPGGRRLRERHPQAFHMERHWLQLRWAVAPGSVAAQVPRAPGERVAVRPDAAGAAP